MIFAPEGLPRLRGLERELSSVNEENKQLEREIEDLRGQVTRLRDDPGRGGAHRPRRPRARASE
jgi:cell division protein FtsB